MRIICLFCIMALLAACSKESTLRSRTENRTDFFRDSADAIHKVQQHLNSYPQHETVLQIQGVSYIDSKDKSYAFVFYRSNRGEGNIVIRQDYQEDELVASQSVKCEGEDCTCKVRSLITSDGTVYLDCNCSSCSMIVH